MSDEWFYYTFRCKVRPNSLYGKLCRFLKANEPEFEEPEFTETDMVLEAGSAYNLPLVFKRLKEVGKCTESEFKHYGRVSIQKLIQRAYFFAQVCGLEGELNLIPVLGSYQSNALPSSQLDQVSNETNGSAIGAISVIEEHTIEVEPQSLLHHQDDEVLDTLFSQN